jgi:glycosyltransferase involved in cell wall biosynthesis
MKKLLFDGLATQSSRDVRYHGGGEYAKYVLREAIEAGYRNFDVVFSNSMIIDEGIKNLVEKTEGITVHYVNDTQEIYTLLETGQYNRFFSALATLHHQYNSGVLFIMVIHGLRSIELPWDKYRGQYYANVILRLAAFIISRSDCLQSLLKKRHIHALGRLVSIKNKQIITVSEHSKYSLQFYFPELAMEDIAVWYSPNYKLGEIIVNERNYGNSYFLMISANRWEKNIYRAVKAFDMLFTQKRLAGKHVIITGNSSTVHFLNKIENKNKFKLYPYVSEQQLEELYKNSFAFVFPSLNEGFGIPPLRAMKYGVPVIASASTSIPEICGNAALYFDPHSIGDLANRLLQIADNNSLYTELVENGFRQYQQYQQYQWPDMLARIFGSIKE